MLSRVSPVSFLLFSNIFLCVYQYFFFADVFKSDIWTEFFCFYSFLSRQPLASVVRLCVLNLEISRDGEDGLRSTVFATVPVNIFQTALYLHCRLNVANCPSPLLSELFSIDWAQNLAALPKISDHPLVSSMIKCGSENFWEAARQKRSCQPGYALSSRGIQNER